MQNETRSRFSALGRWVALAAVVVAMAATPGAYAQLQTGNLYGSVQDESGARLAGVTMTLTGAGAPQVQATGANGDFRFVGLPPGTYALKAELDGFSTFEYPTITVNVGRTTEIAVTMNSAVEDVITVTAESPLLDERRISTGATVTQTELEKIPTARDPWAVLQSTPGVLMDRINVGGNESGQQSQYVGPGSTGDQAIWAVDGMVITDMAATGSSPAYYDFDSFDEMQVTTGGSDATIATGGVVLNMVTKRGTNEWRGTGRYLLMDDSTQSNLSFDRGDLGQPGAWNNVNRTRFSDGRVNDRGGPHAQTSFKQGNRITKVEDYGLELGGPLVKDRLWIWGSYAKPQIDLLTVADVQDFTELETMNLKLNAQVASNNSGTFFAIQSDKVKIGRNAGPTRTQPTTWNQSKFGPDPTAWKIEDTHIFSSSFYLTGLYSVVNGGFQLVPQGGLDVTAYLDESSVWHNTFLLAQTERPQEQIKADASTFFNTGSVSHELKFGAGYREAEVISLTRWGGDGQLLHSFAAFGIPNIPYNVLGAVRDGRPDVLQDFSSLYVQDTVNRSNLTASFALRYDKQGGTNKASSVRASTYVPDVLPAVSASEFDAGFEWESIVPRLGLTYAMGAERKTLLRASYSRFADQLGAATASWTNPLAAPGYAYFYAYNDGTPRIPKSDVVDVNGNGVVDAGDVRFYSSNVNPFTGGLLESDIVDPNLDAPMTDELLLSVEHAVRPEFVVGLNLTYRKLTDLLESELLVFDGTTDANCLGVGVGCPAWSASNIGRLGRKHTRNDYERVDVPATRAVLSINPDGSSTTTQVPLLRPDGTPYSISYWRLKSGVSTRGGQYLENGDREQEYMGFAVTFNKRLTNRWMLRGNFSWADWTWSSVPDSELEDPTQNLGGGDREGDAVLQGSGTGSGAKGGIYINSEWSYSINGLYQVAPDRPWGFNVAADLNGRQGYPLPYFQRFQLRGNQNFITVNPQATDRPDSYRLDDIHQVNARIEKEFTFNDFGVTLGIDGFNLLNDASVLQRNHRLAQATSNHVREIVSPRVFRVGARFSWR